MIEDFVPYEIAKKLKEKGFNIPFYFYYRTDDKLLRHANVTNPLVYCDKIDDEVVIAPTISQVLKWLREEKQLHIVIVTGHNIVTNTHLWGYKIWDLANHVWLHAMIADNSYELAALSGIEFVIDNL